MVAHGDAAGYELAYQVGLDALEEQAFTLRETRERAGSLLSAAAVAGGLAAGLAFNSERAAALGLWGIAGAAVAVGGFVGIVVTTMMIWRPTEGYFAQDAGVIVGSFIEGDPPRALPELHRELALWLGRNAETNREMLEVQLRTFTWGLAFMLLEVLGIVLALGDVASG